MSGCMFIAQVTKCGQKAPAYSPDPIKRARKKLFISDKLHILKQVCLWLEGLNMLKDLAYL